jgi:hypothetical protein
LRVCFSEGVCCCEFVYKMCSVETFLRSVVVFVFMKCAIFEAYVIVYDCVALWNVLLLAWQLLRRVLLLRFFDG